MFNYSPSLARRPVLFDFRFWDTKRARQIDIWASMKSWQFNCSWWRHLRRNCVKRVTRTQEFSIKTYYLKFLILTATHFDYFQAQKKRHSLTQSPMLASHTQLLPLVAVETFQYAAVIRDIATRIKPIRIRWVPIKCVFNASGLYGNKKSLIRSFLGKTELLYFICISLKITRICRFYLSQF